MLSCAQGENSSLTKSEIWLPLCSSECVYTGPGLGSVLASHWSTGTNTRLLLADTLTDLTRTRRPILCSYTIPRGVNKTLMVYLSKTDTMRLCIYFQIEK